MTEKGIYAPAAKTLHNFISMFETITTLRPVLRAAGTVEEFLATSEGVKAEKEAVIAGLDTEIAEKEAHLAEISPKANEIRLAAEKKLESDLKHREAVAMEPINARVAMADNSAHVLEQKVIGLESKIVELTTETSGKQAALDDVNKRTDDFYSSLPERKVS